MRGYPRHSLHAHRSCTMAGGIFAVYRSTFSMAIVSANPTTGEVLRRFDALSDAEIDRKLQLAADTFLQHRRTTFSDRARLMVRAAEVLERRKKEFARLMTLEMGKTLRSAVQEVEKCARACRYDAEHAERFLTDEPAHANATRRSVRDQ